MILGVGTDIIEIERIEDAIRKPKFLMKTFTSAEIECVKDKGVASLAGKFAVKESVVKVFGIGFVGFELKDIEVLNNERGAPYVNLYGRVKDIASELSVACLHVSISHCQQYVVAYVVAESK